MSANGSLRFKIASKPWEFEAIHELNYRTFVEEIPQHEANEERRLVDRFHQENTYLICLDGKKLAGMIALHGKRPFSLDNKLPNLDEHLPPGRSVCEIRLLSVDPEYRHRGVLPGLVALLEKHGRSYGFDTAIISATTRQLRLYRHIGFTPFGPLVGASDTPFQPMILKYEDYLRNLAAALEPWRGKGERRASISFQPGPVALHRSVRKAFAQRPVSHRSRTFRADFQRLRSDLCRLTGARHVEILLGSGTLANDVIAGQISLLEKSGLILTNGEFSERLIDQARRFGLSFETLSAEWGSILDPAVIERKIEELKPGSWLWTVHCETSSGALNNIVQLQRMCSARDIRLCLDCVSTIGTVPLDLEGVYLASAVSGKGLASFAGLAMVFYNYGAQPAPNRLPRYLDLGYYAAHNGIPFTHSSNMIMALKAALERHSAGLRWSRPASFADWLRAQLRDKGFKLIAEGIPVSPVVVTIELPPGCNSETVGRRLEEEGFQLSYRSEYLLRRNWIQICLMGECRRRDLAALVSCMVEICGTATAAERPDEAEPVIAPAP